MSAIEFGRFLAKTANDPDIASALVLAIGDRQDDEAVQAVAAFAQAHGYDVSAGDAATARQSLVAACDTYRDLADDELEGVDGGIAFESAAIIISAVAVSGLIAGTIATGGTAIALQIPEVRDFFKQW